jgi:hypothetical protein
MKPKASLNRAVDELDINAISEFLGDGDHDMRIPLSVSQEHESQKHG